MILRPFKRYGQRRPPAAIEVPGVVIEVGDQKLTLTESSVGVLTIKVGDMYLALKYAPKRRQKNESGTGV